MKRLLGFIFTFFCIFVLVSCGGDKNNSNETKEEDTTPVVLDTPVLSVIDMTVSWGSIANSKGYVVSVNDEDQKLQTETSYTLTKTDAGDYSICVRAIAIDNNYKTSAKSNAVTLTVKAKEVLPDTTLWVVGDSTVCSFSDQYLYPRYGYATQFSNYILDSVTVKNLAMSGRSSKSFISEENYTTLKQDIKSGDYLLIGFGHNDEKSDDSARFTDASKPLTDETSFKYSLYNYYIKVAIDAGATPILCTPIVRLSKTNDYTGTNAHITSTGDYREAIVELGSEVGVTVVDLTTKTKELYESLGYDNAKYLHAVTAASDANLTPNFNTVDGTHINIYGAKMVAYFVASSLKASSNELGKYVLDDIKAPSKDSDLVVNPNYTFVEYKAIDVASWKEEVLENETYSARYLVNDDRLFGTAFGDIGGDPNGENTGTKALEVSDGVFEVGFSALKGKINSGADGFAGVFMQIDKDDNFTASVNGKVKSMDKCDNKIAAFGLMLRDDCYTPNRISVATNYVAASVYNPKASQYYANYSRENASIVTTSNNISAFSVGSTYTFSITRVGQSVDVVTSIGGVEYKNNYTDFDFFAQDNDYFYLAMFSTRGVIMEFSNFTYTKTGTSQGA